AGAAVAREGREQLDGDRPVAQCERDIEAVAADRVIHGTCPTCCPAESNSVTPKSVNSLHCSRGIRTSMTARDAQSGTRTVRLSGGAPRPVTSTRRSAPTSVLVTRAPAVAPPAFDASVSLSNSGATSARAVTLTP